MVSRRIGVVALALGVAAFFATVPARALERAPAQKFRLPNGLILIVQEDHSLPLVAIATLVRGGRAAETKANCGTGALLKAVVETQGTAANPAPGFLSQIEAEGSSFAVQFDEEMMQLETSCMPDAVEANLRRHAELLKTPNLSADAISKAREKILKDYAGRLEYPVEAGYLAEICNAMAYGDHPYGLPNLDPEIVRRLTARDLEEYRARQVVPDGIRIVLSGDCSAAKALAVAKELYGGMSASGRVVRAPAPAVAPAKAVERVEYLDVKRPSVRIGFMGPACTDDDYAAVQVAKALLAEGKTSRLYRRLVTAEHHTRSVTPFFRFVPAPSLVTFSFTCGTSASVEPAVQSVLAEVDRLRNIAVTPDELERGKTLLLTTLAIRSQRRIEQAAFYGRFDLFDDVALFFEISDRIAQISAADVQRACRQWLDPSRYVLAVVKPKSEEALPKTRLHVAKLSNGLNVVLHRDPSASLVGIAIAATAPGGSPPDQHARCGVLCKVLEQGHTTRSTAANTLERLESAGTHVKGVANPDGAYLIANASAPNLDPVLSILREMAFEPVIDHQGFAEARRDGLAGLSEGSESPESIGYCKLMSILYPGHPYGAPLESLVESVKTLTLDDIKKEHERLFATENVWICVAGNLSPSELLPRLEALFGQIPRGKAPAESTAPTPAALGGEVTTVEASRGDTVFMGLRLAQDSRRDFLSLLVTFRIAFLSETGLAPKALADAGILESRQNTYFSVLRGGSYIVAGFRVKPGTGEKAREILAATLDAARAGKVSAEQIEATRKMMQGYFVREFENVNEQAARLANAAGMLGEPDFYTRVISSFDKMSPENVTRALNHVEAVRYVIVKKK